MSITNPTILLAFGLMGLIIMMILPIPAFMLDIGLALSFSLAILIFTVTLFIERPLEFSAFPTVLLTSLMLRLSLNVSSTKLIIGNGHEGTSAAGEVIESFASFIMNGSVFLGLVVFLVLLIVNFMVITKGATRMAEVGARFALDGMPGKQLAIDSDVAAGALSHEEATKRRELEQKETTFFGSLDGASKFVKGDAIAGLLITLLNLIAGLAIGTIVHGMAFGEAFETYAILTVGDGLVSQIPAVIISIAAALLLAKGGTTGSTDSAVFEQIRRYPSALYAVSGLMLVFAILPGLPFWPFLVGAICVSALVFWDQQNSATEEPSDPGETQEAGPVEPSIGDLLELADIHVEFSPSLVNMVLDPGTGLDTRIVNMRRYVVSSFGFILPEVRLSDDAGLPNGSYIIRIQGVEQARGHLEPDKLLALLPEDFPTTEVAPTHEPVYGAPAKWVLKTERDDVAIDGLTVVTPTEILATHLLEVIKRNLSRLFTLKALRRVMREVSSVSDPQRAEANRKLLEELVPERVPVDILHAVLRLLLDELVSIRNLPLILEAIAEARLLHGTPEAITEAVRHRLGFQLVADVRREDGTLPLIQLAPEWEETFTSYQIGDGKVQTDIALPPDLFNNLANGVADKVKGANEQGIFPAIITSTQRRRFMKSLVKAKGIAAPVLSFEEIGTDARPSLVGVVAV